MNFDLTFPDFLQNGDFPPGFPGGPPTTGPPSQVPLGSGLRLVRWGVLLYVGYGFFRAHVVLESVRVILGHMNLKRLWREEQGVEGCGLFSRRRENTLHILGNGTRLLLIPIFAPIFMLRPLFQDVLDLLKAAWLHEKARPYKAILSDSPGSHTMARYSPTGYQPRFILEVTPRPDGTHDLRQVPYSNSTSTYTAISYPIDGAFDLFETTGGQLQDQTPFTKTRRFSLRDRRSIAMRLLEIYIQTLCSPTSQVDRDHQSNPLSSREKIYIWLDELCLSNDSLVDDTDDDAIEAARKRELGRLADIFAGAANVVVVCNTAECNHTSLDTCPWSARLFTLPEILNAANVTSMIRFKESGRFQLHNFVGHLFRRAIQNSAEARGESLHLHTLMKHAPNAGAFTLQSVIHSLIVEAIRRDNQGGYTAHNQLGRALNGLLFRRAELDDLRGHDGWSDLCWVLELNQGHYNAASLAAVCGLDSGSASAQTLGGVGMSTERSPSSNALPRHPWLGNPVLPTPGTERLEPLVTAIPVTNLIGPPEMSSALNIVGPKLVGIAPILRRDSHALYRNDDMKGLRLLNGILFWLLNWYNLEYFVLGGKTPEKVAALFWLTCFISCIPKLAAESMSLVREGWVHMDEDTWGLDPHRRLGGLDYRLSNLSEWGNIREQPVPEWDTTWESKASLVDLRNGLVTRARTIRSPNAMVPLAVHGSGITCMLLDRAEDTTLVSERVGMANLPPYILAQAKRAASVIVGNRADERAREAFTEIRSPAAPSRLQPEA